MTPMRLEDHLARLGGVHPACGHALRPVPEGELAAIIEALGCPLPSTYRALLSTWGAVAFRRNVRFRSAHPLPATISRDGGGLVRCFYGAAGHGPYGLLAALARYRSRMPEGFLPFADNGAGDQLALATRGPVAGWVCAWDHHAEWDEEDLDDDADPAARAALPYRNVTRVAASFDAFLDQLWAAPDPA